MGLFNFLLSLHVLSNFASYVRLPQNSRERLLRCRARSQKPPSSGAARGSKKHFRKKGLKARCSAPELPKNLSSIALLFQPVFRTFSGA